MAQFNPYSGGDAVVNSTPFTQYYLQDLQRKQAKRDALDQYYNNLTRSINTAGVRHTDIEEGLAQKIQDWQNFAMQNKEHLNDPRKDGYRTLNEFNHRYQDILNDTQKSKQAAAVQMQVGGKVFDMQKDDTITDRDMDINTRLGHSIYKPEFYKEDGHTPYGLGDLTIGVPMPKQEYVDHFLDSLAGNAKPTTIGVNATLEKGQLPYQYNQKKTETIGYDLNTLNTIAAGALGYHGDRALEKYFNKQYETPQQRANLNAIFKARTGQDIQNADDVARAMAFQRHGNTQTKVSEEKLVDNGSLQNDLLNKRQAFDAQQQKDKFAHEEALAAQKATAKATAKKGAAAADANTIDVLMDKMEKSAKDYNFRDPDGTTYTGKVLPATENILKPMTTASGKPNVVILTTDKDGKKYVQSGFYKIKYKTVKTPTGDKREPDGYDVNPKTGAYKLDASLTGARIPLDMFKAEYGKTLLGQKYNYGELSSRTAGGSGDDNDGNDNEGASDNSSEINPDDIKQFGGTIRANR